jgi:HlyD family secretion protein
MGKRGKLFLIGGGIVLLGGVVVLSAAKRRQPSTEVRLEKVGKRDLTSIVTASGKIEPTRKVDVSSDITGRIVDLPVREGDMVTRGQVVVRIDPTQYEAAVQRSEAQLAGAIASQTQAQANKDQAERAYTRSRDIRAQNAQLVSQEALEQAETANRIAAANLEAVSRQVDQARAGLRESQDQLRKTTITAPMAGRITRLAVEEGEVAVPGTFSRETGLLMTISDLSVIQVKVKVDETDVVRIHRGDSTEISIDAFPDTTFTGHVTEIKNSSVAGASSVNNGLNTDQAVDYEVIVTLDHPPAGVRPDLSATARIVTDTRHGTVTVPIIALTVREASDTLAADSNAMRGGSKAPATHAAPRTAADSANAKKKEIEGVFVVDTTTMQARFRAVRVGIAGDEYFEVLNGVREGETIVAGPYQVIRDLKNHTKVRSSQGGNRGGPQAARAAS